MKHSTIFSGFLVTVIIILSIFAAGCTYLGLDGDEKPTPTVPTEKPTATATPAPTAEPTFGAISTVTPPVPGEPQQILIRVQSYTFLPVGDREINVGDNVTWRNFERTSRTQRALVSEDGIWSEPQLLPYMRSISYTFNEPGVYTFHLLGREEIKMRIVVKER